jgi:2-polyprenyl-3-methyl-5-hydroxy-6-metoxy-1,4-benzoquinol methylase
MSTTNSNDPFKKHIDGLWKKKQEYHQYVNMHLIHFMSIIPQRVLDIGCAGGKLGTVLKAKFPGLYVAGIEPDKAAAATASYYLDKVITGTFESVDFKDHNLTPHFFDTVILADVIEHMYNPWEIMILLKKWITPDAHIFLSIPNIQNLRILLDVYQYGRWDYQTQGLLDFTHIRFFTRQSIIQFLIDTGYQLIRIESVVDKNFQNLFEQARNHKSINIEFEKITLKGLSPENLEDLCAYQFLIHATLRKKNETTCNLFD